MGGRRIAHILYSPYYLPRIDQYEFKDHLAQLLQAIHHGGYLGPESNFNFNWTNQGVRPLKDTDKELWKVYQLYFMKETPERQEQLLKSQPIKVVAGNNNRLIGSLSTDSFGQSILYLMGLANDNGQYARAD